MAKKIKHRKKRLPPIQEENDSAPPIELNENVKGAFSGWPMIIGWLAMLIFTFHACTHMVAAGDTWVAMACGRHFVNHGVDTVEPFSANSHKAGPTEEEIKTWPGWAQWITSKVGLKTVKKWHPTGWINQNWLTHVIFYSLVPKSSYADGVSFSSNALVYWKLAVYIIAIICVYFTCRQLGVNPALAVVFSCFALFIGRSFLDIRPAGFSNMLVAVFLFVLVLATYRNILFIWLIVPIAVFWCNVHGGYIYAFIMLIPFIGLHLLTSCNKKWTAILYNITAWPFLLIVLSHAGLTIPTILFTILLIVLDFVLIFYKNNLVSIGFRGVCHTVAASVIAFIAVIIFNPFHLTNLTHTFVISVSKNAERWRDIHEWHPAFDWKNPVGTAVPFLILYIIIWLAFAIWCFVHFRTSNIADQSSKRRAKNSEKYQWPKIDLPLMVIASLTIYMAIRSRRFIPIAAIAGCPVAAMLIDQIVRAISAMYNFYKNNKMVVLSMPDNLRVSFIVAGAFAVLLFGTWWGLKFKNVYLDPWPNDSKLNTVFIRMTASDAKPFYAMKFIRDNKLAGKMFNYWTEGGFIAWGQVPDPNTGKTPLQLFMDGRAQAAYDRKTFDEWSRIIAGGPVTYQKLLEARARKQSDLSTEDYIEIGDWLDKQLKSHDVWVVMMPSGVYNDPDRTASYHTMRSLEYNANWRLVFFNDRQKLFVDINTPQGLKLFEGIFRGTTLYPDDFHKNLNRAHSWLLYLNNPEQRKEGLDFAFEAFNENPSPAAMLEIMVNAANYTELRDDIKNFCEGFVNRFEENKAKWSKLDGFRLNVDSARLASIYLERLSRGNRDLESFYANVQSECLGELKKINEEKRW